jgi:hypothetical protein
MLEEQLKQAPNVSTAELKAVTMPSLPKLPGPGEFKLEIVTTEGTGEKKPKRA